MKLTHKQLLGLAVVTQSGQNVGQVIGFELDNESHLLVNYYVSGSPWVTRLVGLDGKALVIARTQVLSMDTRRMVVYDSVVAEKTPVISLLTGRTKIKPMAVGAAATATVATTTAAASRSGLK